MHKEPVVNRFILASAKCSLKGISSMLVIALKKIMKARRSYCNTIYNSNRINTMCWVIDNNMKLIDDLNSLSTNKKAVTIQTFDFERLYTNIDLTDLKDKICGIVDQCFEKTPKYLFT
jgi:hypothetical protein